MILDTVDRFLLMFARTLRRFEFHSVSLMIIFCDNFFNSSSVSRSSSIHIKDFAKKDVHAGTADFSKRHSYILKI